MSVTLLARTSTSLLLLRASSSATFLCATLFSDIAAGEGFWVALLSGAVLLPTTKEEVPAKKRIISAPG